MRKLMLDLPFSMIVKMCRKNAGEYMFTTPDITQVILENYHEQDLSVL